MNDFTKDELEYFRSCPSVGCYDGLYEKIQSLLDSYCEHDPKESSISYTNYFCTRCGKEIA